MFLLYAPFFVVCFLGSLIVKHEQKKNTTVLIVTIVLQSEKLKSAFLLYIEETGKMQWNQGKNKKMNTFS